MATAMTRGLVAGLGMMAAAIGLTGAITAPADRYLGRNPELPRTPKLNRFGKRPGPLPRPSRPHSDAYRLAVIAQRGFSANRIQKLRADWRKHQDEVRGAGRIHQIEWNVWLDQHRTDRERRLAA